MSELSLGLEILGAVVGISAINVGVIMVYIQHLHKETCNDLKTLKKDLNDKFNAGSDAHKEIHERIDKIG